MKILVTGSNGQLGSCLKELAPTEPHKFIFADIEDMDITSAESVRQVLETEKPDWIVNCAAYTAVDKAQSEPEIAELINATAVSTLADEAQKVGAAILHISTDYVFKGDNPEPHKENDATYPVSVYGKTKLRGEQLVARNPKHVILRTSWMFSEFGSNFVKTIQRLAAQKSEIDIVADQWGNPTSAHDLAKAILTVVEKPKYGLYHFSNEGITNWAIFAEQIVQLSGLNCRVNHITTDEYPTPAPRPQYSIMSKARFTKTFGVNIPEWENSLEEVINKIQSQK